MNFVQIREYTVKELEKFGFENIPELPFLESSSIKSAQEIAKRALVLYAVLAVSFGFERKMAMKWLNEQRLMEAMTSEEIEFLANGRGDKKKMALKVEALYALAWVLNIVPTLPLDALCDNSLVTKFPNIKLQQDTDEFLRRAITLDEEQIVGKLDSLFLITWYNISKSLTSGTITNSIRNYVFEQRRWALEWVYSDLKWDEITLDT